MSIFWIDDILTEKVDKYFPAEFCGNVKSESQFFKAVKYINEYFGEFDSVVLDVRFDKGFGQDGSSGNSIKENSDGENKSEIYDYITLNNNENYFIENAGYYLYIYLISKGFPSQRITMLTANKEKNNTSLTITDEDYIAIKKYIESESFRELNKLGRQKTEYSTIINEIVGELENFNVGKNNAIKILEEYKIHNVNDSSITQTAKEWENIFSTSGIVAPKSYSKLNEINDFKEWILDSYTNKNEYYWIRSIVYEACDYWIEHIDNEKILFNRMILDQRKYISDFNIKEMLCLIKSLFTLYKPNRIGDVYFQALRTLSLYFEASIDYKNKEENIKVYYNIMKLFRNWSSHNKFDSIPNSKEFIYMFIITLRSYFDIGEILTYESKAINLLKNSSCEIDISDIKIIKIIKSKLYNSIKDLYIKASFISPHPYKMMEAIGNKENQKCCYNYLFRLLWHGVSEMKVEFTDKQYVTLKSDIGAFDKNNYNDKFLIALLESTCWLAFYNIE